MQFLVLLRQAPEPHVLRLCLNLLSALKSQGRLNALFLMGPAVRLAAPHYLSPESTALCRKIIACCSEQGTELCCCGRAAQNHDLDVHALPEPFVGAGYFELLQRMAEAERVVQI